MKTTPKAYRDWCYLRGLEHTVLVELVWLYWKKDVSECGLEDSEAQARPSGLLILPAGSDPTVELLLQHHVCPKAAMP